MIADVNQRLCVLKNLIIQIISVNVMKIMNNVTVKNVIVNRPIISNVVNHVLILDGVTVGEHGVRSVIAHWWVQNVKMKEFVVTANVCVPKNSLENFVKISVSVSRELSIIPQNIVNALETMKDQLAINVNARIVELVLTLAAVLVQKIIKAFCVKIPDAKITVS